MEVGILEQVTKEGEIKLKEGKAKLGLSAESLLMDLNVLFVECEGEPRKVLAKLTEDLLVLLGVLVPSEPKGDK